VEQKGRMSVKGGGIAGGSTDTGVTGIREGGKKKKSERFKSSCVRVGKRGGDKRFKYKSAERSEAWGAPSETERGERWGEKYGKKKKKTCQNETRGEQHWG